MILVTTYMRCAAEAKPTFLAAAGDALENSRQEAGCLRYQLFEDVEEPGAFVWVEQWENEKLVLHHLFSEHGRRFRAAVEGIVTSGVTLIHEVARSHTWTPDQSGLWTTTQATQTEA